MKADSQRSGGRGGSGSGSRHPHEEGSCGMQAEEDRTSLNARYVKPETALLCDEVTVTVWWP